MSPAYRGFRDAARRCRLSALLLTLASALLAPPCWAAENDRPPNFIVVFCDDLGYADIGPFGAQKHASAENDTPFTVRLHKTGEAIPVPAGVSILEALRVNGHHVPYS